MASIVLIMHRKAIVRGLLNMLQDSPDIPLIYQSNYHDASRVIGNSGARVVLIEAAESGYYNTTYCLALCSQLRESGLECKLLIMCPEQDEKIIKQVVEAKGKGLIDDFVFYDVTTDYLASKLKSISN